MNLTPWQSSTPSPIFRRKIGSDLSAFQNEMNSLMNSWFGRDDFFSPITAESSFYPSIDLKEKENKYLLDIDVPGMTDADLQMDFHNNTLSIKGDKKSEKETKDANYVCVERSCGSFRRDVYFQDEVDQESIKADLKNGVLHVELSKKEPSKTGAKKIAIKH